MFNFFVSKTDQIIEEVMDTAYNPDLRDDDISQLNDVEKVIFISFDFENCVNVRKYLPEQGQYSHPQARKLPVRK